MGGLIAGAAAVGSIPFLGKLFVSKAQAQNEGEQRYKAQNEGEQRYKGRTFRIVNRPDAAKTISRSGLIDQPVRLYLDGEPVNLIRNRRTGRYQTYLLFEEYDSPIALVRALIDLGVVIPRGQREE
jgi:hypothetical protein